MRTIEKIEMHIVGTGVNRPQKEFISVLASEKLSTPFLRTFSAPLVGEKNRPGENEQATS
jgi:hypothetical protein